MIQEETHELFSQTHTDDEHLFWRDVFCDQVFDQFGHDWAVTRPLDTADDTDKIVDDGDTEVDHERVAWDRESFEDALYIVIFHPCPGDMLFIIRDQLGMGFEQ
jgi:hypothetical protein